MKHLCTFAAIALVTTLSFSDTETDRHNAASHSKIKFKLYDREVQNTVMGGNLLVNPLHDSFVPGIASRLISGDTIFVLAQTSISERKLVVNGSFEAPSVNAYQFFSERIPGWVVGRDTIEIVNESYGNGFQAHSGSQLLALNGAGVVYQDIPTDPGLTYRLTFHVYSETDASEHTTLSVSAGAAQADYEIPARQAEYRQKSLQFEGATGAKTTRIIFASTTMNEAGPIIDDVVVEVVDSHADLENDLDLTIARLIENAVHLI